MTTFRRAFVAMDLDGRSVVGVETDPGSRFILPNTGYDTDVMLARVRAKGDVDLARWVDFDTHAEMRRPTPPEALDALARMERERLGNVAGLEAAQEQDGKAA